jgi:hypothetical protein
MAKTQTKANAPKIEEQPQITATSTAETTPIKTLAAKLLHVKASIGKIGKDGSSIVGGKTAPAKTVKYATLPSILERIMPLLNDEGIDYTITPVMSDAAIALMAQGIRIFSIHFTDVASGEVSEPICYPFMRASNPEPIKADGSTITYATRYLLGLALGLQTEEDPEAKMQSKQPQSQPQQSAQQPQQQTAPTDAERRAINAYIEGVDFAKAAEEVKKLQTKYPAYDFSKMIEVASTLKKTFTEFGELVSAGLWEKAEETLTAVKMANPKSKFAVWDKKLADAKAASATADANVPAPF